jgi:hypothetical protein
MKATEQQETNEHNTYSTINPRGTRTSNTAGDLSIKKEKVKASRK